MKNSHLPTALLFAAAICAGCYAGTPVAGAATSEARHGVGKPGAAIKLTATVPPKNAVGGVIAIDVRVTPEVNADELRLEWIPSAGLQVLTPVAAVSTANVLKGSDHRHTVRVSAAADGVYHLGVVATLTTRGVVQSRAFSIRVVVGSAVEEAKPELNRDAQQQVIESMPAREDKPR